MSKREIPDFLKKKEIKFEDMSYSHQLNYLYYEMFGKGIYIDEETIVSEEEYLSVLEWCVKNKKPVSEMKPKPDGFY